MCDIASEWNIMQPVINAFKELLMRENDDNVKKKWNLKLYTWWSSFIIKMQGSILNIKNV